MKGLIISIEGTDGSGKHTQQELLKNELKNRGVSTFCQSFPNYDSESSSPVKMYLSGEFGSNTDCLDAYEASSLYAVDRLCTYKKTIRPHYENGEIILFDRYVQSNFIHQCSKITNPLEREKYLKWIQEFEFDILHLPRPDMVFFIEMPIEKSMSLAKSREEYKNGEQKDIHEEDFNYMKKSYENGLELAKRFGWTIIHCIDNNGDIKTAETIHNEIMVYVNKLLSENPQIK